MVLYANGFQNPLNSGYTLTQDHNDSSQYLYDTDSGFEYHLGEDWANGSSGGTVSATANGEVTYAQNTSGWGNFVILKHTLSNGDIVTSGYAHLSQIDVSVGQEISIGTKLGEVGSTGNSTGPHLHFLIYLGEENRNTLLGHVDYPDPNTTSHGYVDPSVYIANNPPSSGDPDLIVQNASISGTSFSAGDTVSVDWDVLNQGSGDAVSSSRVGVYLSTNSTITTSDELVDYNTTTSLVAGATDTNESDSFTLDASLAPGTYWVGLIADYQESISESNEANNNDTKFQITVGGGGGSDPDLIVQNASISGTSFSAGDTVSVDWDVLNQGSGDAVSSSRVGVYLSTNSTITTSDELVDYNTTTSLVAGATDTNESDSFTLDASLAPGTYWVGLIADYQESISESNEANNNDTKFQITVGGGGGSDPDLIVQNASISGTSFSAGDTVSVDWDVLNQGSGDAVSSSRVGVYLSTNSTITTSDELVDYNTTTSLVAGATDTNESDSFTLDASLAPGTYWVGLIADYQESISESNEANNNDTKFQITVGVGPDLIASNFTSNVTTVAQGGVIDVDWEVTNQGDVDANGAYSGVYLSTNSSITVSDTLLHDETLSSVMSAGETDPESQNITLDSSIAPGTYWIGALADNRLGVTESDEGNNASNAVQITVTGIPDLIADSFTVSATTLSTTDTLDFSWEIENIGNGDEPGGTYSGVYLSTNSSITTSDTLLHEETFSQLNAGERDSNEGENGVALPSGLTAGTYWVGVLADNRGEVSESNEGNNSSSAIQITVTDPVLFTNSDDVVTLTSGGVYDALAGNDTVSGSPFSETVFGGEGNDTLSGQSGSDSLFGGADDDILEGGADADTLDGGTGVDTVSYATSNSAVTVNLNTGTGSGGDAEGDMLSGFENITGSDFGDNLTGDGGDNTLLGGNGADTLSGLGGNDILRGGFSADTLLGGDGDDLLEGSFADDTIDGGADVDTADYSGFGGGITVNLNITAAQNTGAAGMDTVTNVENVLGGDFNDRFTGQAQASDLQGAGGSDFLFGLGGADTLDGGDGNDNVQGGNGSDIIQGGNGSDTLLGGADADQLFGGADNDQLRGGAGSDTLEGGGGRDVLIGGDFMVGGFPGDGAADEFQILNVSDSAMGGANRDVIRDFEDGLDIVHLAAIDAVVGGADDSFTFIGSAAFSGTAGELRAFNAGANTIVRGDVDGDGNGDLEILLNGTLTLDASDFVL